MIIVHRFYVSCIYLFCYCNVFIVWICKAIGKILFESLEDQSTDIHEITNQIYVDTYRKISLFNLSSFQTMT